MNESDVKLRADIIDGVVRAMTVAKTGAFDENSNPKFDKFDLRTAIAMALGLYAEPNLELIAMMNQVVSR